MIKFLSVLLLGAVAQDAIICSGFIRIPKVERANIELAQIEMRLLGPNNQFIDYIEISENGFYSVEIEEDGLIDYIISIQPKVRGFIANPSQINLKFESKTFDEASAFCNKQLNFSIKRVEDTKQKQDADQYEQIKKQEEIKKQQREEQLRLEQLRLEEEQKLEQLRLERQRELEEELRQEQLKLEQQRLEQIRLEQLREQQLREEQLRLEEEERQRELQRLEEERLREEALDPELENRTFDHLRLIGQFIFEGEFTETEKALYYIKSFKVYDHSEEQIQSRTLYFNNYFEVEINDAKVLKLQLVVEKAKEKGESVNKQFNFEKQISKNSLLNRQLSNQPVVFAIKKETQTKEQNKIGQVFAPLIIFALVLAMVNYDKILKKK